MIKNSVNRFAFGQESQSAVSVNTRDTAKYSNGYYKISPQIFVEIKCTNGYFLLNTK